MSCTRRRWTRDRGGLDLQLEALDAEGQSSGAVIRGRAVGIYKAIDPPGVVALAKVQTANGAQADAANTNMTGAAHEDIRGEVNTDEVGE